MTKEEQIGKIVQLLELPCPMYNSLCSEFMCETCHAERIYEAGFRMKDTLIDIDLSYEELDLICRALSDSMNLNPNYCFVEKYNLLFKFREEKIKKKSKRI